MSTENRGMLIVISGPAGSGKGTVVKELRAMLPNLGLSVSATTRSPRPGEEDGVHYYYMSRDDFEEALSHGEILEHTVYCGNYYGTLRSEVERVLAGGHDLILEIEADGAMQVKRIFPIPSRSCCSPPTARCWNPACGDAERKPMTSSWHGFAGHGKKSPSAKNTITSL